MVSTTDSETTPSRFIWLSDGTERDASGQLVRRIASWRPRNRPHDEETNYWKERERVISRELLLATELDRDQGLSLFEMILIWANWLIAKPHFFKDLRGYFNVVAGIMRRALVPYGHTVEEVGESRFILGMLPGWTGGSFQFPAAKAVAPLKAAKAALKSKDYVAALENARVALDLSHGSNAAKRIIASCVFQFGQHVDDEEFVEGIAEAAIERKINLGRAIDLVTLLWKREQSRRPHNWSHGADYRSIYEAELAACAEMFAGASEFLYGRSDECTE